MQETRYELTYTDFLGRRQSQSFIKSKEEAIRRKKTYYNYKGCNTVVKKVVETYKNDECINIQKTTL